MAKQRLNDGWTFTTLLTHVMTLFQSERTHLRELMDERDKRYEQRFEASQKAVDEARTATEKRFESVNEFREAMGDASRKYITKSEAAGLATVIGVIVQILFIVASHFMK